MANKNLWNYQVAEKILKQFKNEKKIVFESGFAPSGHPHIGTYGEIKRPEYVIKAIKDISDKETEYRVFTDDMDGLRKVPEGMPESLREHLGKPVCKIPDPWNCCESFSAHMITRIRKWFSQQNLHFDVFKYSHEAYESGEFDESLKTLLKNVEKANSIILPTMREESRKGWSPFMPVCEKCGKNLSTRVISYMPETDSLKYICDRDSENFKSCGHQGETPVTSGKVKVGWKADWALRWHTYHVNFEMYGKDLMEAATLSGKLVRKVFGGRPPMGYFYEMFLDEDGSKISKSVGRGLTVENWLNVAPVESLDLFLFKTPQKAKKLSLSGIARYVDEYLEAMKKFYTVSVGDRREDNKYRNTYEFISDSVREKNPFEYRVNFNLLTNLIAAVGKSDKEIIKAYVHRYEENKPGSNNFLEALIEKAGNYVKNIMLAEKASYTPTENEKKCLELFIKFLSTGNHSEEEIQSEIFSIAKENDLNPKDFFITIYRLLSGMSSGPRLGSFIHLMGESEVAERLKKASGI